MPFSFVVLLFLLFVFARKLSRCNLRKMDNRVYLPNANKRYEEISSYSNKETKTDNEFENLKLTIKKNMISDALDYSLLEDQVMPELCESPEVIAKHKQLYAIGLSPLLKNMSFEDKNWQEEVSDESFIRTEKLIRGTEVIKSSPGLEYVTPNNSINKSDDSIEPPEDSLEDESEETLKFNDTLEEMEHFLKYGNLTALKNEVDAPKEQISNDSIVDLVKSKEEKLNILDKAQSKLNKDTLPKTPVKSGQFLKVNTNERTPRSIPRFVKNNTTPRNLLKPSNGKITPNVASANCPQYTLTPFKVPNSKIATPRQEKDLLNMKPLNKPINHHLDKFDDVISPIQCYIKNSPVCPIMKNVSPSKNYWDRVPPKNVYHQSNLAKKTLGKENSDLPETAYKSPKVTNMVEKPTVKRLPRTNHRVVSVAENLPRPLVIKHLKREKLNENFTQKQGPRVIMSKKVVDESYAHLPMKSLDVSNCVGKPAVRTRTLK